MPHINNNQHIFLFESFCKKNQIDGKEIEAKIGDSTVLLKVAATPQSQSKGYMHSNQPDENSGIIFVYDEPAPQSFWMKNVPFDLDIIFFDDLGEYIEHHTMAAYRGEKDNHLPRYGCKKMARYAVELCGGWFKKHGSQDCKLSF